MKFEFNMAVKAVPMADVHCTFECSTEELGVLISDPVYQELGRVLATKLSQANRPNRQDNDRNQAQRQEVQDRQDNRKAQELSKLREVIDRNGRAQEQKIETLQSLIMSLRRKIDELNRN